MRIPIICLDTHLDQFLRRFRHCFSQPQYKYFVTILLGLMLCQSGRTLSGILRQVEAQVSLSGTSRFLSQAPWSAEEVGQTWQTALWAEMVPLVEAEHARQKANRPRLRGRPRKTVVTEPALSPAEGLPHWRRLSDAEDERQEDGRFEFALLQRGGKNGQRALFSPSSLCAPRTPMPTRATDV